MRGMTKLVILRQEFCGRTDEMGSIYKVDTRCSRPENQCNFVTTLVRWMVPPRVRTSLQGHGVFHYTSPRTTLAEPPAGRGFRAGTVNRDLAYDLQASIWDYSRSDLNERSVETACIVVCVLEGPDFIIGRSWFSNTPNPTRINCFQ